MTPLRRHQLLRVTNAGWSQTLAHCWADAARACLEHWAAHDLPLVVARQPATQAEDTLYLGLPAPACWGRQRLNVCVLRSELRGGAPLPRAGDIGELLPPSAEAPWRGLCRRLDDMGLTARVYGSFGWQHLTGLIYVRERSDIDLLLPVDGVATADAAALLLHRAELPCSLQPLRLDGELEFPDGSAVAWREWRKWRSQGAAQILVKRLHGVALESGSAWAR